MDGRTGLVVVCAVSGGAWALLVLTLLAGRVRERRPLTPSAGPPDTHEWQVPAAAAGLVDLEEVEEREARTMLTRSLRSETPDLRTASVTALGELAERHDWAIDGLVEALADARENPLRVAGLLDGLAPRPGPRLVPLLRHPSPTVRFYVVRLLVRYPALAARDVPALCGDPSPEVRGAALETLRDAGSGAALRFALRLLEDPHPQVRAQACRTAAALAGRASAPYLVPLLGDGSWWVREAAREALVHAGDDAAHPVEAVLESGDSALRAGAALVLQDIGRVDALADDPETLERILLAGGSQLRVAAVERARVGRLLRPALGEAAT
jgi:HEAT repeat protein